MIVRPSAATRTCCTPVGTTTGAGLLKAGRAVPPFRPIAALEGPATATPNAAIAIASTEAIVRVDMTGSCPLRASWATMRFEAVRGSRKPMSPAVIANTVLRFVRDECVFARDGDGHHIGGAFKRCTKLNAGSYRSG